MSSLEANGALPGVVTVPIAASDNASAAAEEVGAPAAVGVPGDDAGAQRDGEDDEAFMVRKADEDKAQTCTNFVQDCGTYEKGRENALGFYEALGKNQLATDCGRGEAKIINHGNPNKYRSRGKMPSFPCPVTEDFPRLKGIPSSCAGPRKRSGSLT